MNRLMKRASKMICRPASVALGVVLLAGTALNAQVSVRILMGVGDMASIRWDGTIAAQGTTIASIEPWRFEGTDAIVGSTWHVSTHPARLFAGATPVGPGSVVPNGLIVTLSGFASGAQLKVTTAQGDFTIAADEVAYAKPVAKLNGRVLIDRIPASARLTNTPEEEDYPSAAISKNGEVWVAYVEFHHNPDHNALRAALDAAPKDFARWKSPTGGDQIFARKYSGGAWGKPIAITPAGGDLYRSAIAVDGQGRAWVFWAENVKPLGGQANFEIFARAIANDVPGAKVQISNDPGSDIDPVAATDSNGNVWVAWQGWRNGRAAIFAASESGGKFSAPAAVSHSEGNEWNPAIAADQSGRVTVAWDSYRNQNYDVYTRTAASGSWGAETAVAASARYEAYPSIAYDRNGRLWVAYEEGGKGWGKDFGAYTTTGVAVYQGRAIRLRGFEPDGRAVEVAADLGAVLPGDPSIQVEKPGVQNDSEKLDPNSRNAETRERDRPARNMPNARNTLPRLTVDASGRIWLAFRSAYPTWWGPLGTVWTEHLVSFDGKAWTKPIYLNHSDNLLDNRPALVSAAPGQLLIVGSSDNRRHFYLGESISSAQGINATAQKDPYNNDLYASEIDLGPGQAPALTQAKALETAGPEVADKIDLGQVAALRSYKFNAQPELKIVRGEFHRHSEISMDGGGDGTILDQYRYVLDAGALDWVGCCDHDNGAGREYTWWISQKLTDIFYSPGKFVPMFSYERSVVYPEGHRNVIFAQRGVRTLPRMPITGEDYTGHAPDTLNLYAYLKYFHGIAAAHTSATSMGTDWRDNDPVAEPVVEIYQGDRQNYEIPDGPRANSEKDSIGNWRPKGFVSLALEKGYKLGFQASSDHISTHMSYCNLLAKDLTRESVLDAFEKRHVYGSTDNILADVRSGPYVMGDAFSTGEAPSIHVKLQGTSKFAKVVIVKDNQYVYSTQPDSDKVDFTWRDNSPTKGKTSYYYVRGEQDNREIVWISPMWITYTGK
jgi:hypothetical protein